MMAAATKET